MASICYCIDLQKKDAKKFCSIRKKVFTFVDNFLNLLLAMVVRFFRRFMTLVFVSVFAINLFSAEVEFSGTFYEQNAYIKNPTLGSGFCINEVLINGTKAKADLNTGVVVVDFVANGLKFCDKFDLIVKYAGDDKPELINPKAFVSSSTFELVSAKIEPSAEAYDLVLTIKGEAAPLPFYIEHYRGDKWVNSGVFQGKGGSAEKTYTIPFPGLVGENRIRVYQVDNDGMKEREKEVTVMSPKTSAVVVKKIISGKEIIFSGVTEYKVVDELGNTKLHGMSNVVNISSLDKGKYFLVYEDVFKKFKTK